MTDFATVKEVLEALNIEYSINYNGDGSFYLRLFSLGDNWFKFNKDNILLY